MKEFVNNIYHHSLMILFNQQQKNTEDFTLYEHLIL